jgi:hypothetical protein
MDRFVLTARLKPDGRRRALALLADRYDDACQAAGVKGVKNVFTHAAAL